MRTESGSMSPSPTPAPAAPQTVDRPGDLDSPALATFLAGSASLTASMLLAWDAWARWFTTMVVPYGGVREQLPGYPRAFERTLALEDGTRLGIRPIWPDDEAGLVDLHGRLSPETIYQRYLSPKPRLSPTWVRYFANVDYRDRMALVVERDAGGRRELVGIGQYGRDADDSVEVALLVEDAWQGKGSGRFC